MRWTSVFGFEDKALNSRYESEWLQSSLPQLRIFLLMAGVFGVSFVGLDSIYFTGDTLVQLAVFRIGVMLPVSIFCYIMTYIGAMVRWVFPICGIIIVAFNVFFCSLAERMDVTFMSYLFPVIVILALFLLVLLRIPFRIALITGLACLAVCAVTFARMEAELYHRVSFITGTIAIYSFLLFNLFQRDLRERTLFLNQLLLAESESIKQSLQAEREDWFKNFASFLRHEINNQLAGMRGSLDLLERNPNKRDKYLNRARDSLARMHATVNEAAAATSIDAALESGASERIDLTQLISECLASYQQTYPEQRLTASLEDDVHCVCQPFRIAQMLDKLVDNAVRHCTPGKPVVLRLFTEENRIVLEVENEGEALPADKSKLFLLWHTSDKQTTAGSSRQGLGLYVVARIAAAHGGSAEALDLPCHQGARFRVILPKEGAAA